MAGIGEITVPVKLTVEAVEQSSALRDLIKQLIREELTNLDERTANKLAAQVMHRMVSVAKTRG
jgi:hypothetical protein